MSRRETEGKQQQNKTDCVYKKTIPFIFLWVEDTWKTPVGVLPWKMTVKRNDRADTQTGGQNNPHKRLASRKF